MLEKISNLWVRRAVLIVLLPFLASMHLMISVLEVCLQVGKETILGIGYGAETAWLNICHETKKLWRGIVYTWNR